MSFQNSYESPRRLEIPRRVNLATGNGRLDRVNVAARNGTAEIYLHGAHITGFQKNGEPPLLFLSGKSHFAAGEPIRGGVPICFPWFGNRAGEPSHGFARTAAWELVKTSADENSTTVHFALPEISGREAWKGLRTEFVATIADTLTMELTTTSDSCGETVEIENCLHTYFYVGDIAQVSISGLERLPFDDFAFGASGARRPAENSVLRIMQETNRVYPNHAGAIEILDENLNRIIRVEKFNSHSTVVWNPWTTQKLPDDFDPAEHKQMICVESGNVKQNKILLAPGQTTSLKVVLSSRPIKQ